MTYLERAKRLAQECHAGQVDKAGYDYIDHIDQWEKYPKQNPRNKHPAMTIPISVELHIFILFLFF